MFGLYVSLYSLSLISPLTVEPSSLRPSSPPHPLYFQSHHHPSCALLLSSHHMPLPLQSPFLDILCDFSHLRFPSYCFIYFPVPSSMPMCWSYHCPVHLSLDLHVHFPVAQHSRHSLYLFVHPLCSLWVTSASSSPS